jgi:exopolysaccharide biosynthesis predicted pyruvyltransferase EpsI
MRGQLYCVTVTLYSHTTNHISTNEKTVFLIGGGNRGKLFPLIHNVYEFGIKKVPNVMIVL